MANHNDSGGGKGGPCGMIEKAANTRKDTTRTVMIIANSFFPKYFIHAST